MITAEQMRAARALLGWDQAELAEKSRRSLKTIKRMEASHGQLDSRSNWAVKNALELGGVEFLDRDDYHGRRGEGVRFQADRTAKLRQELTENVSRHLEWSLKYAVDEDEDLFERPTEEIVELVFAKFKEAMRDDLQSALNRRASSRPV